MHLVELEDLPWVPAAVRDGGTDLLDFFFARIGFYRALVDVFARALDAAGGRKVVDLCSGGGGGALYMSKELRTRGRADVQSFVSGKGSARGQTNDIGLSPVCHLYFGPPSGPLASCLMLRPFHPRRRRPRRR